MTDQCKATIPPQDAYVSSDTDIFRGPPTFVGDFQPQNAQFVDSNADGKKDTVTLGQPITPDNFKLFFNNDDMVILPKNGADPVTLKNFRTTDYGINEFKFDNGTTLSTEQLLGNLGSKGMDFIYWDRSAVKIFTKEDNDDIALGPFKHFVSAGPGRDSINVAEGGSGAFYGDGGSDYINIKTTPGKTAYASGGDDADTPLGGSGMNILNGDCGPDELWGGLSNGTDFLSGGPGGDKYRIRFNGGSVTISDNGTNDCSCPEDNENSDDTIIFGSDINLNDLTITQQGDNLVFTSQDGGMMQITNHAHESNKIENFIIDGTRINYDEIIQYKASFGQDKGIAIPGIDHNAQSQHDLPSIVAQNYPK